MTPEEFRQAGHQLIDWIADYRQTISEQPVKARVKPGDVKAGFSSKPPQTTTEFPQLLQQMDRHVVPGITQVQHPMHFGWFPSNASLTSVLGDIASSGLGTLGISWESCPALTEVEQVVCDWMRQLAGLSDQWQGTITDTASTTCTTVMLAAREKASNYAQNRGGLQAQTSPLVVYSTLEAHSSVQKAALLAGYGSDNIQMIEMDNFTRSMNMEALQQAIEEDINKGKTPTIIVASIGSTGITAIDPIKQIVEIAEKYNVWVHVDAAMAGSAMLLPECRWMWEGVEQANSISWNPHKWMGTILDCSLLYVCEPEDLIRAMSTNPSYLQSSADGQVVQYRDWGIPLGRRFRALKLWFHLELDGIDAIQDRLRRDIDNAKWFAEQVESTPGWEVVAPVNLQTVCVRHRNDAMTNQQCNQHTLSWLNHINQSGKAFLSPAKLEDLWMVRVSIGVEATERRDIEALWELMKQAVATQSQSG